MMTNTMTTYVQMNIVDVPKSLQDGEKFVRWEEDSVSGTPVTMRIDPKGFYLCWVDQNNEVDLLDISTIRDVRTGQYAKKPKDTKLRQIVTLGMQDTLEEKTVSVCYGSDFVNVSFINFSATRKEIAQLWTDELMKIACSLMQLNGSSTMFLQKAHTKLCLQVDKTGKIPVKNIIKLFASNKEDKRRVEKALVESGLPPSKGDTLPIGKFQFEDFFNLYKNLTQRTEVEKIFDDIVGSSKHRQMSTSQLVDFLNKKQRDPRLNEILYPYVNPARAKEIIYQYEQNEFNAKKGQLSLDGFLRYLLSEDNPIITPTKSDLCDDMDQPLAHYFINSSHNTYLTGHQLTGKSSVEIYRQSLLAGCRCVELDFWNGRTDEPVIVHGYTFVPDLFAKDVLEAIAESAFKTSEFPVILSFENHCGPRQQVKIANYCREIFGDMLLDKPLDTHPLEQNMELPAPTQLRRKIIIKNKKKDYEKSARKKGHIKLSPNSSLNLPVNQQQIIPEDEILTINANSNNLTIADASVNNITVSSTTSTVTGNGDVSSHAPPLQQIRQSSKDSTGSSDTECSSDDESSSIAVVGGPPRTKDSDAKETEAGAEISALVNYVQPVHFSTFDNSEKKNRYYEMSSFDEKQATTLLKEHPIEFVNYNKHQLSRVYPAGTRFDSSNFMPQLFWNAGCQLVALNYQTLDLAMQLNLGTFDFNQRCGYLLKPEFMRRKDRRLDPFAESTVDGIIAGTVSITVLSGQFLTDKKVGTYIEVDMFGLPADTVRKRFRTKAVRDNGINPVYGEEPFVFKKVVLPELASIRIAAYEEGGKFIGHRVLPVLGLCPGYRHLTLRNELGQPLCLATLFLCIIVGDFVHQQFCDFAEALANPIKYQSQLEKRSEQLSVYTEETDITDDNDSKDGSCKKKDLLSSQSESSKNYSPKHRKCGNVIQSKSMSVDNNIESSLNVDGTDSTNGGITDGAATASSQLQSSEFQNSYQIHNLNSNAIGTSATSLTMNTAGGTTSTTTITTFKLERHDGAESLDFTDVTAIGTGNVSGTMNEQTKEDFKFINQLESIGLDPKSIADALRKILDDKIVKEKRLELEKKLDSIRKKHDKEKVRVSTQRSGGDFSDSIRKSKFYMNNKLVKRLSSKNIDLSMPIPPCPSDFGESSDGDSSEQPASISRSQSERLITVCRGFSATYQDIQEKYCEIIYGTAEKVLKYHYANELKELKISVEKETNAVMRTLNVTRRNDVKQLAVVHKDRDELIRMKREVASTIVNRGVTERTRLAKAYENRRELLYKQNELVKDALTEHKRKAREIIAKETEPRSCLISDGFLVLFNTSSGVSTSDITGSGVVVGVSSLEISAANSTAVSSTSLNNTNNNACSSTINEDP